MTVGPVEEPRLRKPGVASASSASSSELVLRQVRGGGRRPRLGAKGSHHRTWALMVARTTCPSRPPHEEELLGDAFAGRQLARLGAPPDHFADLLRQFPQSSTHPIGQLRVDTMLTAWTSEKQKRESGPGGPSTRSRRSPPSRRPSRKRRGGEPGRAQPRRAQPRRAQPRGRSQEGRSQEALI